MSKSRESGAPAMRATVAEEGFREAVRKQESEWFMRQPKEDHFKVYNADGTLVIDDTRPASDTQVNSWNLNGAGEDGALLVYDSGLSMPYVNIFDPDTGKTVRGQDIGYGGKTLAGGITSIMIGELTSSGLKELRVNSPLITVSLRRLDDKAYPNRGKFADAYAKAMLSINRNFPGVIGPGGKRIMNGLNPNPNPNGPKDMAQWLAKNAKKYGYEFSVN